MVNGAATMANELGLEQERQLLQAIANGMPAHEEHVKAVLQRVAATGDTRHSWTLFRPLIVHATNNILDQLPDNTDTHTNQVGQEQLQNDRRWLMSDIETLSGIPWTIQRFCEVLLSAQQTHPSKQRLLAAMAPLVQVTSTVAENSDEPHQLPPAPDPMQSTLIATVTGPDDAVVDIGGGRIDDEDSVESGDKTVTAKMDTQEDDQPTTDVSSAEPADAPSSITQDDSYPSGNGGSDDMVAPDDTTVERRQQDAAVQRTSADDTTSLQEHRTHVDEQGGPERHEALADAPSKDDSSEGATGATDNEHVSAGGGVDPSTDIGAASSCNDEHDGEPAAKVPKVDDSSVPESS